MHAIYISRVSGSQLSLSFVGSSALSTVRSAAAPGPFPFRSIFFSLLFFLAHSLSLFLGCFVLFFFSSSFPSHLVSTVTQWWSWFNVTCNGTQRGTTSLFFLNAPVEIKSHVLRDGRATTTMISRAGTYICTYCVCTCVSDLHPKEQHKNLCKSRVSAPYKVAQVEEQDAGSILYLLSRLPKIYS